MGQKGSVLALYLQFLRYDLLMLGRMFRLGGEERRDSRVKVIWGTHWVIYLLNLYHALPPKGCNFLYSELETPALPTPHKDVVV